MIPTSIKDVKIRERVQVCGRIVAIQVEPAGTAPSLTARIEDSTGRLDAVFVGRREIPGVEPGQVVSVSGAVAQGSQGPVIYNPRYELCQQ